MKILINLILQLTAFTCFCQSPPFYTINNGGGTIQSNSHSVTYSIGDNVISTLKGTERLITQGFQQPRWVITTIKETPESALIKAYPNPVSEELVIDFPTKNFKKLSVWVYTLQGQLVFKSAENQTTIPFRDYADGDYILIFRENQTIIKSIKIVKIH